MTTLCSSLDLVNIVVAFDAAGALQQALARFAQFKGFVSATLLENDAASRSLCLLQWQTYEDHLACMNHPSWREAGLCAEGPKPVNPPERYTIVAQESATRDAVLGYTEAWMAGDLAGARQYLADDVSFQDPVNRFTDAEQLIKALGGFREIFAGADVIGGGASGNSAFLLYDCKVKTPVGSLRCAEYFTVEGGKIKDIKLLFDRAALGAQ
jgi:hypothetical protein